MLQYDDTEFYRNEEDFNGCKGTTLHAYIMEATYLQQIELMGSMFSFLMIAFTILCIFVIRE